MSKCEHKSMVYPFMGGRWLKCHLCGKNAAEIERDLHDETRAELAIYKKALRIASVDLYDANDQTVADVEDFYLEEARNG